jgi:hypothetical protein
MFRSTSLTQRMAVAVVLVVIATAVLMAALNIVKFRRVVVEQERAIYGFEIDDIRGTIENSFNLSLPLSALHNTQPLIERRAAEDPAIVSITIYDETGIILFDTDPRRIDQKLPEAWSPDRWSDRGDVDGTVLGTQLVNNFGKLVGGIVLRYDPSRVHQAVTGIVLEVTVATLATVVLIGLCAVAGVWWVLRRPRRELRRMDLALVAMVDERQAPRRRPIPPPEAGFAPAAAAMLSRLRRAGILIDQLSSRK